MALRKPSGTKISRDHARAMIHAHKERAITPGTTKLHSILVDKEVLLKLINQDGCEGIRLYLGLKNPNAIANAGKSDGSIIDSSHSFVLVGADADGNPITVNDEYYDDLGHCPPDPPPSTTL